MPLLAPILSTLIAAEHIYILTMESLLWTTPRVRKIFKTTPEFAAQTRVLAANQGLYNGFLAAGLIWGLLHPVPEVGRQVQLFFLGCVGVAGVVGGATVGRRILFVQTGPAVLAVGAVLGGL